VNRRKFIALVSGLPGWPLATAAQSAEPMRRIGILMSIGDDQEGQARISAFRDKLKELGRLEGRDVRVDICWADGDVDRARACAAQLVGSAAEVILSSGPESLVALRRQTQQIPIVFVQIGEPVESGVVSSLAHPGGNVTGSAAFEYAIGTKWIELLKQIAPGVSRVGVLSNSAAFTQPGYLRAIEATAPSRGMIVLVRNANNAAEIESSMDALARESNGLIVLPSSVAAVHRELIVSLANRYKLPAVYAYRFYTDCGSLLSYGNNVPETFRQAAAQVDRILRGTRAGDLPIQFAPKFELVINLRSAKALGLKVPRALLVRADEVIE
jgi:putative ABC transport system substrate-binding protein